MAVNPISSTPPVYKASSPSFPDLLQSRKLQPEHIDKMKTYLGPGYTNTPGSINIFFLPFDIIQTVSSLAYSASIGDEEGELDARLRLAGMPANLFHCLTSIASIGVQAGGFLNVIGSNFSSPFLTAATPVIAIAGTVLCLFEGAFEILNARRQGIFLNSLNYKTSEELDQILSIKNPALQSKKLLKLCDRLMGKNKKIFETNPELKTYLEKVKEYLASSQSNPDLEKECLEAISSFASTVKKGGLYHTITKLHREYLSVSPETTQKIIDYVEKTFPELDAQAKTEKMNEYYDHMLQSKLARLARRVQPWCAKEIATNLPAILEKIRSNDPKIQQEGFKEAEELIKMAKIQAQKKLLVHVISIIAILLSLAAFVAMCFSGPFALILILLVISGLIATSNGILASGTLNQKGWAFSIYDCIPDWVKWIGEKIWKGPKETDEKPKARKIEDIPPLEFLTSFRKAQAPFALESYKPTYPSKTQTKTSLLRARHLSSNRFHARAAF